MSIRPAIFVLLASISVSVQAGTCQGRFVNPITDICWSCIFPLSIGSVSVYSGDLPDTPNPASPVCACGTPVPRVGINVGFWEPARLVDVTRQPFCFVNLGGMEMKPLTKAGYATSSATSGSNESSAYHVHWYVYPVIYWLNILIDAICLEQADFDIAYLSELDPLWGDDELSFILNPEAALFANPIAQTACAADCVAASTKLPLDPLFWCAGCQGSMYPLNGHVQSHIGGVQASTLLTQRFTYKMHRQGLLWGTSGSSALCGKYPMPIMKKSQYRSQMTYPVAGTSGKACCNPFGRTTQTWEAGKEFPVKGEDFGYLLWRKRNCCAL